MLVDVYLDGALGREFGKKWELSISRPKDALALIQANTGRLTAWLRANVEKFANYKVLVTYKNGNSEYLDKDTFFTANNIVSIRFTPIIKGAGNMAKVITGVVLMVASIWLGPYAFQAGLSLTLSGVAGMLAPKQKAGSTNSSHYFQGVGKNQMQGNPVPLIYGRCKVDAQVISSRLSVESKQINKTSSDSKVGILTGNS